MTKRRIGSMMMALALNLGVMTAVTASAADVNLLPQGGFESDVGWTMTLEDGAEGAMAQDDAIFRSGAHSLRLPPGATRVVDTDSRRVLADGVETYTFWIDAGETVWLWFDDKQ